MQQSQEVQSTILPGDSVAFTMSKPEFDQSSFLGRFESFRATVNPFNTFTSDGQIREM